MPQSVLLLLGSCLPVLGAVLLAPVPSHVIALCADPRRRRTRLCGTVTGRLQLPLNEQWNGLWVGQPLAGEMNFSFAELIAHAAFTRRLGCGTLVGLETVSNVERSAGSACIEERRAIETIEHGASRTNFMQFGDRVRMECLERTASRCWSPLTSE